MRSRRRDVAIVTDRSADSENHEIICPIKLERDYSGWIAYNDKEEEGEFVWEDGCTSSYTNWGPNEPNNDPDFGGEDCTIKWNDGTVWNDVPCDFTYPCYCQPGT